ncbi:MAG TPA: SDR family NAD(P)-dependent oxidoreductase [Candidatus Limnocylindria bacterium]|nr:SDR family NAD(P)-dependent oxidoreductase [Candidatus Limnocylindria bacterium]
MSRSDADLARRAALVTGATGNLGRAVVRMLAARGAHVAMPVRDAAKAEAVRASLAEEDRARVLSGVVDPLAQPDMDAFVDRVLREWGRVDILVSCAGRFALGPATDLALARDLWRANVEVAAVAAAACLRPMRARGYGRIVCVSAASAQKGSRNGAAYAMTKAALLRWAESLAAEVKGEGITVNAVLPSTIDDPANRAAMPRTDPRVWASPDEVTAAILFLCSLEASGITGAAVPVAGRT